MAENGNAHDAAPSSTLFLSLLRTQEDVSIQIASYLPLPDLFHAIQSCRTAMRSSLRLQVLRTTRLEIPPDAARARALLSEMDPLVRASVKNVDVADMRSVELLQGQLPAIKSLRLRHHKYLLRDEAFLDLHALRGFSQLTALDLSNLSTLDDLTGLERLAGSLQSLNVSHTNVGDLTPLYMLRQLVELNVASTPVDSIIPLSAMVELRTLDVSYTLHLDDLSPLRALQRLKKLVLNSKSIVRLDAVLSIAGNLTHLEISDANVQSISLDDREELVSALVNVEHLDLSWSRFLPRLDALIPLKKLRVLNLSGEKYPDLTPLSSLCSIEELYIKQDVDVDLSVVGTLSRLRKLFIYGLRPHTGSVEFLGNLQHLEVLDVSSLFRLGMPTLAHLKTLGVTVLAYSDYFKYPVAPRLTQLKVLTRVDLNQVLAKFAHLTHLYLEDIDRIPLHSLAKLTQLETLEIGRKGSQQQPLPEDHSFLRPLTKLHTLRVHWTLLADLFVLTGLTQLKKLTLDGTPVVDVWHLTALTQLEVLSVVDTRVRNVTDLTVLTKLRKIFLPKHANCSPLLDAFHAGAALDNLKEVCHPTQNCLWGQHRTSA